MPLVISYGRFSKGTQRKGHSRERQLDGPEKYCARMGWTLDVSRSFFDPGMSAFRSKHAKEGAFAGFLAAVKAGKIRPGTILIVEHLDRLSRDKVRVARDQFEALLDAGIEIVTLTPEKHYTKADLNDLMGLMEPLWTMYLAHEQSRVKSERLCSRFASDRIKRADSKAARGKNVPAWVKIVGGKYVEDKPKCETIREVYRLATEEDMGAHQIARKLNADGVPSIGKSGKWNTTYVQILLGDRRVLGECQQHVMKDGKRVPTGEPIRGYYPSVVDNQTYYRAQASKADRTTVKDGKRTGRGGRKSGDVANLFTGLIYDQDGATMQTWRKSTANRWQYLTSSTARGRAIGSYVSFPYEYLELSILGLVIELTASDLDGDTDRKRAALEALEGEHGSLSARIGRLSALVAEQDDPAPELMAQITSMNSARKALAERIEVARAEATVAGDHLGETKTLIQAMRDGGEDGRRKVKAALPRIIDRITVSLTRTDKRAVLADVTVRWVRGDVSTLLLHSRQAYHVVAGQVDRLRGPAGDRAGDVRGADHLVPYSQDVDGLSVVVSEGQQE